MKIIDAHTHFYPEFAAANPVDWARGENEFYWAELVGKRDDAKLSLQGFPSKDKFLRDMDDANIERAIIQGWYWENSSTCEMMNSAISKLVKAHPERLSAFAAVQPADKRTCISIASRARDEGFCGVGEIHSGVQKFDFNSDNFEQFAKICSENELPICVHLTEKSERVYKGKVATDNLGALNAAKKFDKTVFILAHWCGAEVFADSTELKNSKNIYFDTAATPLQFCGDKSVWARGIKKYPNAAIFGSDYPIRLYPRKFRLEELSTIVNEAKSETEQKFHDAFFHQNISKIVKF